MGADSFLDVVQRISTRIHDIPPQGLFAGFFRGLSFLRVRPADLQDGAEKRVQSPPNSTAQIEAQLSGVAPFPEE
jgi:hypothetical protein